MAEELDQARWANAEWLAGAHAWIKRHAARLNREITGSITQPHMRPWATAMRIPTDRGVMWFKATVPSLAHESAITEALSRWSSGRTPQVLAYEPARNWLLMEDGGVTLRSTYQANPDPKRACRAAEVYAGLQKNLAPHIDEILELGVPDCRLATFPTQFARLLGDSATLRVGEEECLTAEEMARLQALAPVVTSLSSELASFGISETLQHDDLHSNNVLVQGDLPLIFDWGDCSVSHPLFSLVVLLRSAARDFDVAPDSPTVREIRDSFLSAWDLPLSQSDIGRACLLADALGRINRALTWQRLLPGMREPHFSAYVSAASGWLQEFLEAADAEEVGRPGA